MSAACVRDGDPATRVGAVSFGVRVRRKPERAERTLREVPRPTAFRISADRARGVTQGRRTRGSPLRRPASRSQSHSRCCRHPESALPRPRLQRSRRTRERRRTRLRRQPHRPRLPSAAAAAATGGVWPAIAPGPLGQPARAARRAALVRVVPAPTGGTGVHKRTVVSQDRTLSAVPVRLSPAGSTTCQGRGVVCRLPAGDPKHTRSRPSRHLCIAPASFARMRGCTGGIPAPRSRSPRASRPPRSIAIVRRGPRRGSHVSTTHGRAATRASRRPP